MNNGYGPAKVATRGRCANYQWDHDSQALATPIVKRAVRNLARSILGITKLSRHTPNAIKLQDVTDNICSSGAQACIAASGIAIAVGQANQHYSEHKICACEMEGAQ